MAFAALFGQGLHPAGLCHVAIGTNVSTPLAGKTRHSVGKRRSYAFLMHITRMFSGELDFFTGSLQFLLFRTGRYEK